MSGPLSSHSDPFGTAGMYVIDVDVVFMAPFVWVGERFCMVLLQMSLRKSII